MPRGRPKKQIEDFLPKDWKEKIYQWSSEGQSAVEIRANFCMAGGTFSEDLWTALEEREEEFSRTVKKASVLCQQWWEKQGRTNLRCNIFQTGLWYANMKNRFGWRDTQAFNVINKPEELPFIIKRDESGK